jgi:hypothetical protein
LREEPYLVQAREDMAEVEHGQVGLVDLVEDHIPE